MSSVRGPDRRTPPYHGMARTGGPPTIMAWPGQADPHYHGMAQTGGPPTIMAWPGQEDPPIQVPMAWTAAGRRPEPPPPPPSIATTQKGATSADAVHSNVDNTKL